MKRVIIGATVVLLFLGTSAFAGGKKHHAKHHAKKEAKAETPAKEAKAPKAAKAPKK